MSKPLELTWYPKDPSYEPSDAFTVYLMGDGGKECAGTACALPSRKRLTDAELAAEYFNAEAHQRTIALHMEGIKDLPPYERAWEIQDRLYDFATLPHFDEVAA